MLPVDASAGLNQFCTAGERDIFRGGLVSMRNRLIHAYFDIDHDILWKTAVEEVPELLGLLRPLVPGN